MRQWSERHILELIRNEVSKYKFDEEDYVIKSGATLLFYEQSGGIIPPFIKVERNIL